MGKEELLPAHKIAIELLEKDPIRHFDTLAAMYQRTIVSVKDIPELLEAFSDARARIEKEDDDIMNEVFNALRKQGTEVAESGQMEESEGE